MGNLNRVQIIGRLAADPESRSTPNGTDCTNVSIAVNEQFIKEGQKQTTTEYFRCVFWGKKAEVAAKYLAKGSEVYVEGKLKTRKYQDKNGIDRYSTELHASNLEFLGAGGARDQVSSGSLPQEPARGSVAEKYEEDDVPF